MKIDVDRLHAVINGEVKQRGCGHTVAKVEQLVGFIEVQAVSTIICKCLNLQDAARLRSVVASKINCLHLLNEWPDSLTFRHIYHDEEILHLSNGVSIKFVPSEYMLKALTGVSDYLLLDFTKDFTDEDSSNC